MTKQKYIFAILATCLIAQGCAPVIVGGAATTASVVHDRRSTGTFIDDNAFELALASKLAADKMVADNSHINITSYNGQVLLTGEAFNEQIRNQAVAIAQAEPHAKVVQNQIVIGRRSTFWERAYDSKQTAKIKVALKDVTVPGFDISRVKVVTEHGITYLMGLVSEQEAQAAANVARKVSGVKEIVTYFEIM